MRCVQELCEVARMAAKEADKATAQRTTEKTETKQAAKVDAASKAAASKPPPLGYPGGPEIANKDTLLSEVDAALGCKKPPAIEYLFVEVAFRCVFLSISHHCVWYQGPLCASQLCMIMSSTLSLSCARAHPCHFALFVSDPYSLSRELLSQRT